MTAPPPPLAVSDIEEKLKSQAESLCWELFPNGKMEGRSLFRIGSVAGEAGQSLFVHVDGAKCGNWRDMCGSGPGGRDRGDLLWLIASARFGGNLGSAVQWAKSWLRLDDLDPERLRRFKLECEAKAAGREKAAAAEIERTRKSACKRWHMGVAMKGTPVEAYLRSRGADFRPLGKAPGALRFNPAVQYGFGDGAVVLPAMVAQVNNLAGDHIATHRTWLKPDGSGKADAGDGIRGKVKKTLGAYAGGHIPVWKGACGSMPLRDVPAGTDVYVSEGIEDACNAACAAPERRIVCGISVGNFLELELPPQMGWLVFLKQNDPPGSEAETAFQRAVAAQRALGRRVKVAPPPAGVKDITELVERALERAA